MPCKKLTIRLSAHAPPGWIYCPCRYTPTPGRLGGGSRLATCPQCRGNLMVRVDGEWLKDNNGVVPYPNPCREVHP
jgi:hypothetical protein